MSSTATATTTNTFTATAGEIPKVNNSNEKENFLSSLKPNQVEPLWTVMSAMVPPVPQPNAISNVWKYNDLRPLLEESGRLVPTEESERRVLMLINPNLKAPQTTDTLYAGLQYINEGEVAPAHRHSAFALRFILEGNAGFTNVEGSKMYMKRGDVILTPRWLWHDHGNDGPGPMIWLDGLDLPMFQAIPVNFAENYEKDTFPAEYVEESPMLYPWAPVQEYLDSNIGSSEHAIFHYKTTEGNEVSSIISAQAEKLCVGGSSPVVQDNSSFVFNVYKGRGHTVVGSGPEATILKWEERDTFCIPSWRPYKHVNEGDGEAYLFGFSDTSLLKNLGIHRNAST